MKQLWLTLSAVAFALGACSSGNDGGSTGAGGNGGGGGGGGGGGQSATGIESATASFVGTRPIQGLEIRTRGTDTAQTTDANGEFEYASGDIIEVFIDKLSLGTAPARRIVTADDLSGSDSAQTAALSTKQTQDFSNRTVNALRTLETLGQDNGTNFDLGEAELSDAQVAALQLDAEPDTYAQSYNDAGVGGQPLRTEARIVDDFVMVLEQATEDLQNLIPEDIYGTWSVATDDGRVSGMAFRANGDLDVFGEIFDNPDEINTLVPARWRIITSGAVPALEIEAGGEAIPFTFAGFERRSIVVEASENGSVVERFTLTPVNIPARLVSVGDWLLDTGGPDPEAFSFSLDGSFVQGSGDDQLPGNWSVDALNYVADYGEGRIDDCFFSGLISETDLRFVCELDGSGGEATEVVLSPQ